MLQAARPGRYFGIFHIFEFCFISVLQELPADLFCGFEQCTRLDQAVKLGHLGVHDDIGIDRRDGLADFLIDCRRRGGEERLAAQPQRAVSITEGFSPLFGVDATLLNNITGKFELRKTRNLSLNISSYQLVEALSNEFVIGVGYKLTEFNKVLKMKKTRDFSNDLTIRLDFSYRKMQSLIRKIEDQFTQATSGNIAKTIQFSADYGLSRALTLRAFYDLQINEPIVSTSSYPTSNSNYGISLRFSLAQ